MGNALLAIDPKPSKPFRITFTGADDQTSIQDMLWQINQMLNGGNRD